MVSKSAERGRPANQRCQPALFAAALAAALAFAAAAAAQLPDHPILTELYQDPPGDFDGPVDRDPSNAHQEFVELYLPPAAGLDASLNKDQIQLTLYNVEGDFTSPGLGLVNWRIDLPVFDLDPSNGLTGLARPSSGVVVIGWVDYVGDPPTALFGTPATRRALVHSGITSTSGYTFIALNGAQFGGTTNFPVPLAVSVLDLSEDPTAGFFENGSSAYLLVNRTSPGYVTRYAQNDAAFVPPFENADLGIAFGGGLGTAALLDAVAPNDDPLFVAAQQPYPFPSGLSLDLESVLPQGGLFSRLVPQVAELAHGHARTFADSVKTTDDANALNDSPAADSLLYRSINNLGPLGPTPGSIVTSSSPAQLEVAQPQAQVFEVLGGTAGRPGVPASNSGGLYGMNAWVGVPKPTTGIQVGVQALPQVSVATGQTPIDPPVYLNAKTTTPDGYPEVRALTGNASKLVATDPNVVNPTLPITATFRVLNPTQGLNASGQPFQATAFVALRGLPNGAELNELLSTSLGSYLGQNLGGAVDDAFDNGPALLSATTDLASPAVVLPLRHPMPTSALSYLNAAGPAGREDLVTTVLTSAERSAGNTTYNGNFNGTQTAVKAVAAILAPTRTKGGRYVPIDAGERIHYADATGSAGDPHSGLSHASTTRGFELALVETNVEGAGLLETGATDDFGIVVRAARVRAGSPIVPGEFVFLSLMGGLEGADVDTLDVPPHANQTVVALVDLDPLDTVLGVETIDRVYAIDGSGNGSVDLVEVFSLAVDGATVVPEPGRAVGALAEGAALALLAGLRRRTGR
jgi:hypothetical protein